MEKQQVKAELDALWEQVKRGFGDVYKTLGLNVPDVVENSKTATED